MLETSWNLFLIKKRNRKEAKHYGSFLSVYSIFDQRTVPFYEMRSTAKLMSEGLSDEAVVTEIVEQNLFQYPTEKSITRMAKACMKRLHALEDETLVSAIASQPTEIASRSACMR